MAVSWPYIAGFFDGEGSLRMPGGYGSPHINIAQSRKRGLDLLTEIQSFLSTHGIKSNIRRHRTLTGNGHEMFYLYMYSQASGVAFLRSVFPYLHIKKLEAQDMLRYFRVFPSWVNGKRVQKRPRTTTRKVSC
jgi:intein/homing endonuclease